MSKIMITPLGTVLPYGKDTMNCPCFLIEYNHYKILLDCGNGITRMLKFPQDLNHLNVFITHYHEDHCGDLGVLQYASYVYHNLGTIEEPINLYLPFKDFRNKKQSILANKETYSKHYDIKDNKKYMIDNLQISFHNNHSHTIETYMIKLETNNMKVVYTSDVGTTNIKDLIDFCSNTDLLICESSFLRSHHSSSTTHLTAYQAGEIAKLARVRKLLLTIFGQKKIKTS